MAAWGSNISGQTDVPDGNDFIAVEGGAGYSVALKDDGSLVAWGHNAWGETDVPPGNKFVAIAAGYFHGVAIEVPEPSTLISLLTLAATLGLWAAVRRRRK